MNNTAIGAEALQNNTTGDSNTATGVTALFSNTTGSDNTAIGRNALQSNTEGGANTALGGAALAGNTVGDENTATGEAALLLNTTGSRNTATGDRALFSNTGNDNVAVGRHALFNNSEAAGNTAVGGSALEDNTTGLFNTASGFQALVANTTGSNNAAVGNQALGLNTTGSNNIALGAGSGNGITTATDVIAIGLDGVNVSNSCFIGRIRGVTTSLNNAIPVLVDTNGQLGTLSSSHRFKKEIKPMDAASEAILALKPVTFHYKIDKTNRPEFGLIAEEVAQVDPSLVVRDGNGEIYTVRYDAVNAMLLNEFLKEHRKVESLEKAVAEQQKENAAMRAMLKELAAQIQKVSAQLEVSKPAPQTVLNNQ